MRKLKPILFLLFATTISGKPVPLDHIREEMMRWEGRKSTPYRDGDHYSVGVGHNLTIRGLPIRRYSSNEIERFLLEDISWSLDICRKGIYDFDSLPESVQLVAIGVAFGCGRTGFMQFKSFRACLSYRYWEGAAIELRESKWAKQVGKNRLEEYLKRLKGR